MKLLKTLFLLIFISCQTQTSNEKCDCEKNLYVLIKKHTTIYTENEFNDLLCCINNELKDKVELSQITNELVFDLLYSNTSGFIKSLENPPKSYDENTLLEILETPLNDKYSTGELIIKVKETGADKALKEKIIMALEKGDY